MDTTVIIIATIKEIVLIDNLHSEAVTRAFGRILIEMKITVTKHPNWRKTDKKLWKPI